MSECLRVMSAGWGTGEWEPKIGAGVHVKIMYVFVMNLMFHLSWSVSVS